jgi:hypothetical protein
LISAQTSSESPSCSHKTSTLLSTTSPRPVHAQA